jgi:hypothetical protein
VPSSSGPKQRPPSTPSTHLFNRVHSRIRIFTGISEFSTPQRRSSLADLTASSQQQLGGVSFHSASSALKMRQGSSALGIFGSPAVRSELGPNQPNLSARDAVSSPAESKHDVDDFQAKDSRFEESRVPPTQLLYER